MGARNFLDVKRVLEAKRDFLHEVVRLVRLADGREWPGPGFPPELPMQEVFNSGDDLVAVYAGGDVQQTLRRARARAGAPGAPKRMQRLLRESSQVLPRQGGCPEGTRLAILGAGNGQAQSVVGGQKPVVIRFDGSQGMRSGMAKVVDVSPNWPNNQARTPLRRADASRMQRRAKPKPPKQTQEMSTKAAGGPKANVSVNKWNRLSLGQANDLGGDEPGESGRAKSRAHKSQNLSPKKKREPVAPPRNPAPTGPGSEDWYSDIIQGWGVESSASVPGVDGISSLALAELT